VALPRLRADEYAEGLMEVLEEAVRLRLMSDVPLGAMLSGGLDSTLIVALMARHMSQPVKTFSVGFAEDHDTNELTDARYVSSVFGTEHHELELSFLDNAVDLGDLVWSMDEPLADVSTLGFDALSRLASQHVTVALSGQGADELLGGYKKHRAAALVGAWMNLPAPVRTTGGAIARRAPGRFRRAGQTLAAPNPVDRLIEMSGRLGGGLRESLYRGPLHGKRGAAALETINELAPGVVDSPLSVTLHIDAQLALADLMLHYFDRASMAHSLEVRVPFLDHRVVEYCAGIPADLKVRRLQTKYVLKRGARGIVPSRIIHKRKLGFFVGPSRGWLQARLAAGALEPVTGSEFRCAEFLDPDEVARLARAHQTGDDTSNTQLLTAILMLETWLQSYLPRALAAPPASPVAMTTR
jgi:asparagine synthase (glutamine-hydrolysing)